MNSSRTLLASLPTKTPRRRVRGSNPLPPNVPPSRDLIGPPCPLSNLRPVYYAPLFPSLHNPSTWSTSFESSHSSSDQSSTPATLSRLRSSSNPHPYSLSEFPSTNSLSPSPRQQKLSRLKQKLHSEDLEYRLARYRFDSFNQDFWVRMNTRFLESRDRYVLAAQTQKGAGGGEGGGGSNWSTQTTTTTTAVMTGQVSEDPSATSSSGSGGEDVDLAPFYALHLAQTKRVYQEYNTKLWRMQAKLIGLAVRDVWRRMRWNLAVWRAGGEE